MDRQNIETEAKRLLKDKSWKGHLTTGIIMLIVWAIVTSPLFTVLKAVLELVLLFGGLGFILWAGYQYFQAYEKKK